MDLSDPGVVERTERVGVLDMALDDGIDEGTESSREAVRDFLGSWVELLVLLGMLE